MVGNQTVCVGLDVGSLTAKAVLVDAAGTVRSHAIIRSAHRASETASRVLDACLEKAGVRRSELACIIATGYGRLNIPFARKTVSEVICHARGVNRLFPAARTIIDMGGQDTKVISIDEKGTVKFFAMNDKCAAGTGRFLEVMSNALDISLEQFSKMAASSHERPKISSTCTVFAESEIIGMLMDGVPKEHIAAGLCDAISARIYNLLLGVPLKEDFAFTGGGAKNEGIVRMLQEKIGHRLLIPDEPQTTGALGAAIIGLDMAATPTPEAEAG